ncbi:TetR/AcrR family transcriptional regulator [Streptomyces sp. RKND-216]|uniref:TetR/AcrR family transcriptional regulator n=1 Tax=Streptomyces sp. RKND-216 TaxID=2562581 RepID=UPI001B353A9A|nr:TetR/AcrR family transcriptional regulator [Streptomyces sp. RKND-216]
MAAPDSATSKRQRTSARILRCALDLFERQGFERTTVAQIAASAGVTEMTFFRHFRAKENVVLDDPYDPLIAAAVASRPHSLGALPRTVRGIRHAWRELGEPESDLVRRRVRIVALTPTLRAAAWRNNAATEQLIVDQLVRDGTPVLRAHAAAGAALAALLAALFEWARRDDVALAEAVAVALDTLDPPDTPDTAEHSHD